MNLPSADSSIDHSRGLCHKPDLVKYNLSAEDEESLNLPRELAEKDPPSCRCCGGAMIILDMSSESMSQLGMYELVCPTCPSSKS